MSFLATAASALGAKLLDTGIDFGINNYMFNRQKHWQQTQLTHAHQWEVEDLKNAGLNPILSANTGASGASAPAWSGQSNTSVLDTLLQENELNRKDKEIKNQTKLANSQVALNAAQAARILELTPEEVKTHQWGRQSRIGKELGVEKEYNDAKKMLVNTVQNSAKAAGEIQGKLESDARTRRNKIPQHAKLISRENYERNWLENNPYY